MKIRKWPLIAMLAGVALLALPLMAGATNTWGNYHWARTAATGELPLSLGDNVSGDWDGHLAIANGDWNDSSVIENTIDAGRTSPKKCSPGDGLVEVCNAKYDRNGWLGIAGISASSTTGHIVNGYVKVNDSYFGKAPYNTAEWRQVVMCQEIGHIFGLGHQDEDFDNADLNTCMDYSSNPAPNQHPNAHDYTMREGIYAHFDDSDSWASAPEPDAGDGGNGGGNNGRGGGGGNPNRGNVPGGAISDWGRAIGNDANGRPNLFELDLGNGNKLFTHVTWAD